MGDWGLGPIPNPQSPIPNPQSPIPKKIFNNVQKFNFYSTKIYYIYIKKKILNTYLQ
jgi:hypothetical protein